MGCEGIFVCIGNGRVAGETLDGAMDLGSVIAHGDVNGEIGSGADVEGMAKQIEVASGNRGGEATRGVDADPVAAWSNVVENQGVIGGTGWRAQLREIIGLQKFFGTFESYVEGGSSPKECFRCGLSSVVLGRVGAGIGFEILLSVDADGSERSKGQRRSDGGSSFDG